MKPTEFHTPDLGPVPLLFGPPETVDGYYEMERIERNVQQTSLTRHAAEVGVWGRFLTLHREAFLRGFDLKCPDDQLQAWGLRIQLLGLGAVSSKAALDMLLVGSYSVAFASIRHMIESHLFCRYVQIRPKKSAAFYRGTPEGGKPPQKPRVADVVSALTNHFPEERDQKLFGALYASWKSMGAGSHPSGTGIVQTIGDVDGHGIFGATYHSSLARDGFNHGLLAAGLLVHEIGLLEPQGDEWESRVRENIEKVMQLIHRDHGD